MVINLRLILMLIAIMVLALAAFRVSSPRVDLTALGLALWALAIVVG